MAIRPKKSDYVLEGAGNPNYVKDMVARGKKSGTTTKVPNPNGDKLMPVKPKPAAKSVMPKVTPKTKAKPTTKSTLTKAEKGIAKELSPKGVKKTEKMQKNAIDKKYPGMFKKAGK